MKLSFRYWIPLSIALLQSTAGHGQVVNGSFEEDVFGAPISGWQGGASVVGQPIGTPLIPPFFTPAPPVGIDGSCSAGLGEGQDLRQTFILEGNRTYQIRFAAKSLSGLAAAGRLRVQVLASEVDVMPAFVPSLQVGGAGSQGFQFFSISVKTAAAGGAHTLRFVNVESRPSHVAIDAVSVEATEPSRPPRLARPVVQSTGLEVLWSEPSFGYRLEQAPSPSGPWTPLATTRLRRDGGNFRVPLALNPNESGGFFRMTAVAPAVDPSRP